MEEENPTGANGTAGAEAKSEMEYWTNAINSNRTKQARRHAVSPSNAKPKKSNMKSPVKASRQSKAKSARYKSPAAIKSAPKSANVDGASDVSASANVSTSKPSEVSASANASTSNTSIVAASSVAASSALKRKCESHDTTNAVVLHREQASAAIPKERSSKAQKMFLDRMISKANVSNEPEPDFDLRFEALKASAPTVPPPVSFAEMAASANLPPPEHVQEGEATLLLQGKNLFSDAWHARAMRMHTTTATCRKCGGMSQHVR